MAMLSDLVRIIAEATGDPESTVTVVARSLREAGFIATGGRGRSAAKMTAHDAASLLLGIGSPGDTTKAAETLSKVGQMKLGPLAETAGHSTLQIAEHEDDLRLKAGQTLHDCLSSLVDRLTHPPEEVVLSARQRAPLAPGARRNLLEPFTFDGDVWPSAVGLEVVRDGYGLHAHLDLRLRGGTALKLHFNADGASWIQMAIDAPEEGRGKHSSITLLPRVASSVASCLRGNPPELEAHSGATNA
jgi:hypothetical protein